MGARFGNLITVQGIESDDARMFMQFIFRELPLTARWARQDNGAHQGAEAVAVLDSVREATPDEMKAAGLPDTAVGWWGEGEYVDGVAAATEAVALAAAGAQFWSADPGGQLEYHWEIVDPQGNIVDGADVEMAYDKIWYGSEDAADLKEWLSTLRERTVFDLYEVGGITQVDIPCWPQCRIRLTDTPDAQPADGQQAVDAQLPPQAVDRTDPAVARARASLRLIAAGPQRKPAAAFAQREFDRYTDLTVTDDGYFEGHICAWNACHRGFGNRCVTPPVQSTFEEFHTGHVLLDDGSKLKVGVITDIGGHAEAGAATVIDSIEAYTALVEDPRNQLGMVRLYRDQWGIQACGVVHPDVTPERIAKALAARPSGDWRAKNGVDKLYGIAMVNTPGYTWVEEAEGEVVRMVAAIPPPAPGDGTLVNPSMLFFDASPEVLAQAACPTCPGGAPSSTEQAADDGEGEGHGCGGNCGGDCCGGAGQAAEPLSASSLADLADLDRAMRSRQALAK